MKKQTKEKIKKGDDVLIDRGSLGRWHGKVKYIRSYGWAMGIDCFGTIETALGETHSFDTCVHGIIKL
jgi:hypothetical protein